MPSRKRTPLPSFITERESAAGLVCIRTADETDVQYVLDRARKWSNEVGFIPASGMELLLSEGRGLVAEVNGELAGYLLTSGGLRTPLVVRHNTVEEALWEHGVGGVLMRAVLDWSAWTKRPRVLVRTRVDLLRQANINASLGGIVLGTDQNVGKRLKPVEIWSVPRDGTSLFAA
mgnify:CR=1 FL=1